jgi:hypothetical protein
MMRIGRSLSSQSEWEKSMEADIPSRQQDFVDPLGELEASSGVKIPVDAADAARSTANILRWRAYLPENCVRTMIAMGWDLTT